MKPSYQHRFLSVPTGTRLDLQWPRAQVSLRAQVQGLFGARKTAGTPAEVDADAFRAAFKTLADDPAASATAFGALGYTVTTAVHDSAGGRR